MNEPWGISGPGFLALYGAALAIAVVWALVVRLRVRRGARSGSAEPVGLDELAYLTGGGERVVELAMSRLLLGNKLRTSRTAGGVKAVEGARAEHPVDAAVLSSTEGATPVPAARLGRWLENHKSVRAVRDRVVQAGLVTDLDATARSRKGVIPLLLLGAVGVLRWFTGLFGGYPIGYLTLLLLLTGLLAVLLRAWRLPALTSTGARLTNAATQVVTAPDTAVDVPGLHTAALRHPQLGPIALRGFSAYPDQATRISAIKGEPKARSQRLVRRGRTASYADHGAAGGFFYAGGLGGGSGCGSGSSDGGGGCGGGGGGCGGGGGG
ncbi:TIGR04222 domain-containing membrane protein [Allokutzneria oryzae]|uniref:TIGR04222 domain-containing membrane protein n=1 Tax=Allokutzneria oryzae TaxID=1378989 RepID=A0ABV5ZR14_9PSEU